LPAIAVREVAAEANALTAVVEASMSGNAWLAPVRASTDVMAVLDPAMTDIAVALSRTALMPLAAFRRASIAADAPVMAVIAADDDAMGPTAAEPALVSAVTVAGEVANVVIAALEFTTLVGHKGEEMRLLKSYSDGASPASSAMSFAIARVLPRCAVSAVAFAFTAERAVEDET
jgi:hypothetical protein